MRRHADFSGIGGAAHRLSPLWQGVKRERLDFLADNPLYTTRFAYYVGRRCRSATIKDVAAELKLDWHTVKTLDQHYMQAQLERPETGRAFLRDAPCITRRCNTSQQCPRNGPFRIL
jgi:hypothetical protein